MTQKDVICHTAILLCSRIIKKIDDDKKDLDEVSEENQMLLRLCHQCLKVITVYQSEKIAKD